MSLFQGCLIEGSLFQGCSYFRGVLIGVLISGVPLFQGCPYFRGVFIEGSLFQGCPYRGVLILGVFLFQGCPYRGVLISRGVGPYFSGLQSKLLITTT